MKIATFADLHAHLFNDFSEPDEIFGNTRMGEIVKALRYMFNYCDENCIDFVLFAGDMFQERKKVDTTVWNKIYEEIKRARQTVIAIPGNHDQVDNSDYPEHSIHGFKDLPNFHVYDKNLPDYFTIENEVNIFPVPYSKNAVMIKELIKTYVDMAVTMNDKTNILLGHLGVSGAFVGKSNYAMADAFSVADLHPEAFDFGVFGHFHKWQFLGGYKHFFYAGAPIQHNFNDEGQDKGFWVLDTETKMASFVPTPSPQFITVTDINVDPQILAGNYVRFQISESQVEELNNLAETIPDLKFRVEPQKVYIEEKRVDIDFSMSYAQIVTEFAKKFNSDATDIGLEILREAESG